VSDYTSYIARKLTRVPPTGIASGFSLPGEMFPHQSALTAWALRRGRAAIFADTGLGKMRMELAYAAAVHRYTKRPIMIHTPLAVAPQLAAEAARVGIVAKVCREPADLIDGINISNYERRHKFDTSIFGGVVLDESGCIKHHDTRTFQDLTAAYADTPFKLPATATPAPNDWTELGTHAEFLGICTRQEMLAEFFCHDGGDTSVWRLKGHARELFWRWVATWGAMVRRPSDLGFEDAAYALPPLYLHQHQVDFEMPLNGMLFAAEAQSLSERREARRASMADRISECVARVFGDWNVDDLEAAIRREQEGARSREPGVTSEAYCVSAGQSAEGPGSEEGLHGGLLQSEPGEIPSANTGAVREVQRTAAQKVRGKRGMARVAQSDSEGLARQESSPEEGATPPQVRPYAGAACSDAGGAERGLRNLQDSPGWCEDVSDDRPLPHDRQSARDSLLALQHGDRQVQRQPGITQGGNRLPLEPWIIWVELNAEQDALEKAFGSLAFSVRGSQTTDEKEQNLERWLAGERPVMISKISMLGYGINMQLCHNVAFIGVTDSFESYYQAVRRCWRFGQTRDVHVHIFASKAEGAVVANLKRKEREAGEMAASLSAETRDAVMAEVTGLTRQTNSHNNGQRVIVPAFLDAA